jgi:cobalamin biosynthesis protein CobT
MNGRLNTAKMSVVAIAEALLELGFEFEVTGFNSVADPMVERKTREMSDSSRYNRTNESLRHFIFKRFGVNSLNGITTMSIGQQNVDGESVRWAAKRLGEQKQKRKILMVFSDGSPAANGPDNSLLNKDLIESVKMIEKSGIETIGIGIQTDAVRRFYRNAVVVSSLEDLPKKAMSELTKIILKGR